MQNLKEHLDKKKKAQDDQEENTQEKMAGYKSKMPKMPSSSSSSFKAPNISMPKF